MMRGEEGDVDTVFIGFATWWSIQDNLCPSVNGRCVGRVSAEEVRRRFLQELCEHIHELKGRGKRVIVSLPFPIFDRSIPDLEVRNAVFGRFGFEGVSRELTLPGVREEVSSAAS